MALEVVDIVKKVGGGVWSLVITNALYHMKTPKLSIVAIQPSGREGESKHVAAQAFIDVKEADALVRNIRTINKINPEEVLTSYKGGPDKKYDNRIVSRVLRVKRDLNKNAVLFSIEILEGEQSFATNKYGQKVPGIVKPKRGGETFLKNMISLTRDEALFVADMIDRELMAWRVVLGADFMRNPSKYLGVAQQEV